MKKGDVRAVGGERPKIQKFDIVIILAIVVNIEIFVFSFLTMENLLEQKMTIFL